MNPLACPWPSAGEWLGLLPRLALVALAVGGASLAARRGGHRVAGWLTGLPVIIGPLMGLLLIDHAAPAVAAIARAALQSLPATLLHACVFAWAAQRWAWPACIGAATSAYLLLGGGLHLLPIWLAIWLPTWQDAWLPSTVATPLLLVGMPLLPALARRALPASPAAAPAPVPIPTREVAWRTTAALAVAASVLLGAPRLSPAWSGLLVAVPIAGSVLPCFTLPLYGPAATVQLLRGFLTGLHGFAAFLATLVLTLPLAPPALAWVGAVLVTAGVSLGVRRWQAGRR